MKNILLQLVATNSGWIARQLIKWAAVITALITTHLSAKGLAADESMIIATLAASIIFGVVELALSFIAKNYKVPEADKLKLDINKLRNEPPTVRLPLVAGLLACVLLIPSCATNALGEKTFVGLTQKQWLLVTKDAGNGALKGAMQAGVTSYGVRRLTSAKDVLPNIQP